MANTKRLNQYQITMAEHQTPRIDGSLLSQHVGSQPVRIIGRVESVSGDSAELYTPSATSDNLKIKVSSTPDLEPFIVGTWFEVIARVFEDESVKAIDVKNFGENINEKAVAALVKYSNKASELFYQ